MRRRRPLTAPLLGALVLGVVLGLLTPAAGAADPTSDPVRDPVGANDWSCEPSAAHPRPVVLVHGTYGDRRTLLDRLSASLAAAGYCVFSLDYGDRATGDIRDSAHQLGRYVERVRAATGAARVSLVGHSQGGMMARYYLRFLDGARRVDDLVGLVPINHGSERSLPAVPGSDCTACRQRQAGSAFLRHLNHGDETPGRVSYTQLVSRTDEIAVPYTTGYLEPGPRTTNLTLQDLCPAEPAEHLLVPASGPAIEVVLDALAHRGPAAEDVQPSCVP